jgi:O-antigen/teichoic acid export membrane protein
MSSIKQMAFAGSIWSILQVGLERGSQTIIYLLLAKTLGAESFGVAAIATAPAIIAAAVVQGLGQVVVQADNALPRWLDAAFCSTVLVGAGLSLCVGALGPALAIMTHSPDVARLAVWSSLAVFATGLGTVSEGILIRNFAFKFMAFRRSIGILVAGTIALFLAYHGYGSAALVVQLVLTAFISALICMAFAGWLPRGIGDAEGRMGFLKFGAPIMGTVGINMMTYRMNELVIGVLVGPSATGVLRLTQSIIDLITSVLIGPLTNVFLSACSRFSADRERATRIFISLTAIASIPLGAIAIVLFAGFPFATLVFPLAKWPHLGSALAIVSLSLPFVPLLSLSHPYLVATRRPTFVLASTVFQVLLGLSLISTLGWMGIIGAAIAALIRPIVAFGVVGWVLLIRIEKQDIGLIAAKGGPLASFLLTIAVAGPVTVFWGAGAFSPAVCLASIAGAVSLYLCLNLLFSRRVLRDFLGFLPSSRWVLWIDGTLAKSVSRIRTYDAP